MISRETDDGSALIRGDMLLSERTIAVCLCLNTTMTTDLVICVQNSVYGLSHSDIGFVIRDPEAGCINHDALYAQPNDRAYNLLI
jgi:hypothetical protein